MGWLSLLKIDKGIIRNYLIWSKNNNLHNRIIKIIKSLSKLKIKNKNPTIKILILEEDTIAEENWFLNIANL